MVIIIIMTTQNDFPFGEKLNNNNSSKIAAPLGEELNNQGKYSVLVVWKLFMTQIASNSFKLRLKSSSCVQNPHCVWNSQMMVKFLRKLLFEGFGPCWRFFKSHLFIHMGDGPFDQDL